MVDHYLWDIRVFHICHVDKLRVKIKLTNSTKQSPSREANWFAASQIHRILWNQEFHAAFTSERLLFLSLARQSRLPILFLKEPF